MEITGVTDTQAVAKVGDTSVDLEEGMNANCGYVIGICSGAYTKEELQAYPHTHLIDNLIELKEILFAQA
jgi:phosphoglycolate phosphatase-like HAD superfamily hydrolase